jgi:RNA polymerase sigma-70 factor (ECF subfamily)
MLNEGTFQDLIRRVRAGDDQAAAELLRLYEPAIRRTIRVRLAGTNLRRLLDTGDICQSVFGSFFVRAALGQYELDRPEQLLQLLVSMGRKKLADQQRRELAARRDQRRVEGYEPDGSALAAPGETPSQQVAYAELLGEARRRLSPDERRLADRRAEGRDWADIAAEEGGSPEALRKKLSRAVQRISEELGLGGGDA